MGIFESAKPILTKLIQNGHEAYFVGGCVRDKLLKRDIGDIDIATSALPEEVIRIFPKTVPTGLQHGTVLVIENNQSYEITTFRTESTYQDFRRPSEVTYVKSIEEDLKRRDFTMNAIAMTVNNDLIDPFNGRKDIANGLIQSVGNAKERFHEDALRMIRGIRFVSQLGFRMDECTFEAILSNNALIEKIAIERISVEFEKLLLGKSPKDALKLLIQTELINHLPNFKKCHPFFNEVIELPIEKLKTIEEYWALILFKMQIEHPESILRNWKMSNERIKQILKLHALLLKEQIIWSNSTLYIVGLKDAIQYERLQTVLGNSSYPAQIDEQLKARFAKLPIHSKSELCISGNDLLSWSNLKGGPWLKEVISEIEVLVVENRLINTQLAVKEWFTNWLQR